MNESTHNEDIHIHSMDSDDDLRSPCNANGKDTMEPAKRETLPVCIVRSYAGFSLAGVGPNQVKKINQDALLMMEDPSTLSLVFGCFDGHGAHGHYISQFLKTYIELNLLRHPSFQSKDFPSAISETIAVAEALLLQDNNIDTDLSGSTMVLSVLCNNKILVANVGDSRAVLCQKNSVTKATTGVPLSVDHKPSEPFEKYRILAAGGRVFPIKYSDGMTGPDRVWQGTKNTPGLAMSRSICDSIAHSAGVVSTPTFVERTFEQLSDRVFILASDGLWDVMENEEAASMSLAVKEPSSAVSSLIKEAKNRWQKKSSYMDDITVCVVFFH